jgi:hypothetical protein
MNLLHIYEIGFSGGKSVLFYYNLINELYPAERPPKNAIRKLHGKNVINPNEIIYSRALVLMVPFSHHPTLYDILEQVCFWV